MSSSSASSIKSDIHRPSLPRDPYGDDVHSIPFLINSDSAIALNNSPSIPTVILVLGAPSTIDLEPLLLSPHLSSSLVILALHKPPLIHPSTVPAVRILRLADPFHVENAGAVLLVSILERAERVARIWRKNRLMGCIELGENDDGAHPDTLPTPPSSTDNINKWWSKVSISPKGGLGKLLSSGLPPVDPSQRPFDGLFNYLPPDVAEKSLLKQAILVTTIAHPFLCAVSDPEARPVPALEVKQPRTRRWSVRGWTHSIPTTTTSTDDQSSRGPSPTPSDIPATDKAHLVHLLPLSPRHYHRSNLLQSLESFLQSFAYPVRYLLAAPPDSAQLERAAPFVLPVSTLAVKIQYAPASAAVAHECTVTDMLLRGLLDPPATGNLQKRRSDSASPRVWIGGAQDFVVLGADWSSGNTAGLAKMSLAARPGLGLGSAPRRPRVITGRVAVSSNSSMGMRSSSAPNVHKLGLPPAAFSGHKPSWSHPPAATTASANPTRQPLTRAETDFIFTAFNKSMLRPSHSFLDVSKLSDDPDGSNSGGGGGSGGLITPPTSDESGDSHNVTTRSQQATVTNSSRERSGSDAPTIRPSSVYGSLKKSFGILGSRRGETTVVYDASSKSKFGLWSRRSNHNVGAEQWVAAAV